MKTQVAKAKGRRLQQKVAKMIIDAFHLEVDDITSRSMGSGGEDLLMSPNARRLFDVSVECKNTERLNIWNAIEQAESNAGDHIPLVVFSRNRSKVYVVVEFGHLLNLWAFAKFNVGRIFGLEDAAMKDIVNDDPS